MHRPRLRLLLLPLILAMTSACSIHSVATHWNGRVGPDGHPVYVRVVTNIGINLAIIVPLLGSTSMDEMIDESTYAVAEQNGDHVRVIETTSENYWHGFPPFTWIMTPVITTVGVEYRPSAEEMAAVQAADDKHLRNAEDPPRGNDAPDVPEARK